jgi:putative PEP-CTERM system histidine kinase
MNAHLPIGEIGFGLAAIGYLLFWALLLTVKHHSPQKQLLMLYSLVCAIWAALQSLPNYQPLHDTISITVELLQKTVLVFFLISALSAKQFQLSTIIQTTKLRSVLIGACVLVVIALLDIIPKTLWLLASLMLTILLLTLVEALYRQAGDMRRQYTWLTVALGGSLLFDFYLLSEATLISKLNLQTWQARGYVHLVLLPILVLAIRRIEAWSISVYISRDIVLQSSMLLGAGAYLSLLGLVGYYLSYIGGDWTSLIQAVFIVAGCAILALLMLSEHIRRRSKVFIEKHFFANSFDYRQKWIELTTTLKDVTQQSEHSHAICLKAWCQAIGYSNGVLLRFQPHGYQILASQGKIQLNDADHACITQYPQRFAQQHWLLDMENRHEAEVNQLLSAAGVHQTQFQMYLPIRQHHKLWGLCLLKGSDNERRSLNWELRDYLTAVAEQISSYLFMLEQGQQLSENAQFAAFSRMSAFVVHDLKNVKAQLDMLLKNAQRHRHNPEFIDDAFTTMAAMQSRLQHMLNQLTNKQSSHEQIRRVNISQLCQQVITERCQQQKPTPRLHTMVDVAMELDSERFANVLFHLIDNAQQATPDDGEVELQIATQDNMVSISIRDTGCGMSDDFIKNRLFKPFDTTKGNAGMGIGAYDAQQFIAHLGGQLLVESKISKGTTFTIQLPLN